MRALALTRRPTPGTLADVIKMTEIANPAPRSGEVAVKVHASTINIDDIHIAEGTFYGGLPIGPRPHCDRPVIPGSDIAGTVIAVGKGVHSFRIGDPVFGVHAPFQAKGAWAEICPISERWLTVKPDSVRFGTAAACGVAGLVAFSAIDALNLRPGRRIVIVGATGGIGSMAVQLAARAGSEVIGICGPAHVDDAYRLGCSVVLDYAGEPWDSTLRKMGRTPVDGVVDSVGGSDVEEMGRRVLASEGVFVTVVGPQRFVGNRALGWSGVLAIAARIARRIIGSRIRGPRYVLTGPGPGGASVLGDVAKAAAAGVLPSIDSTVRFELEPMRQALRRAAAHQNHGQIVISMEPDL
ncbi:MAG: NADP-dependent oxidoreductase [Bryobacteraceae bacterium]